MSNAGVDEDDVGLAHAVVPLTPAQQAQMARNGHSLIALHGAYMLGPPRQLPDWQIFALGCLSRASYTLQTILANEHREVDCLALARSVYEHVVTMAWVAIDGPTHYPRLLRWERNERMKMLKEMRTFKSAALPADAENVIKRATIDASHTAAPELFDRAVACDRHWPRSLPPEKGWTWHFERSYGNLFRYCSAYTHATAMGVDSFIHRFDEGVQIGMPRDVGRADVAVCAVQSFGDGLAVASLRFEWPTMHELLRAFTTGFVP